MLAGLAGYEESLAYLQGQLNTLKAALATIQQYGVRPGTWSLEDVQTRYRTVLTQLNALRQEISGRDMPSDFMLRLSSFSDGALKFGTQLAKLPGTVVGAVSDVASGAGTIGKFLPILLIGGLVVLGIGLSKGSLGVQIRR